MPVVGTENWRALAIFEQARGPEHPKVTAILKDYADVQQRMNRDDDHELIRADERAVEIICC
jgi:hypothetical protein